MSISDPSKSHYGGSGALIKKYVIKSKSIFKYLVQIGPVPISFHNCVIFITKIICNYGKNAFTGSIDLGGSHFQAWTI